MALIEWADNLSVGMEALDADHQILASLINQLDEAISSGQGVDVAGSVLIVLVEYTHGHFMREEMLMEKGGYPDLDLHRDEHEELLDRARAIQERYLAGDGDALDEDVLDFLKDWLVCHIEESDRRYSPYVQDIKLTQEEIFAALGLDQEEEAPGDAKQAAGAV